MKKRLPIYCLCLGAIALMTTLHGASADNSDPHFKPVEAVASQSVTVSTPAGTGQLAVFASNDLSLLQPDATRAVIIIHGALRNAAVFLESLRLTALAARSAGDHALLLAPQFLEEVDSQNPAVKRDWLRWPMGGWSGGGACGTSFD